MRGGSGREWCGCGRLFDCRLGLGGGSGCIPRARRVGEIDGSVDWVVARRAMSMTLPDRNGTRRVV